MLALDDQSPYAADLLAERVILGAVLLRGAEAFDLVQPHVGSADFAWTRHQRVYDCFVELTAAGSPVNLVAVAQHVKQRGWQGVVESADLLELTEVSDAVAVSWEKLEHHARTVRVLSRVRDMQSLARLVAVESLGPYPNHDPAAWLESVEARVAAIIDRGTDREKPTAAEIVVPATVAELLEPHDFEGAVVPASMLSLREVVPRLRPKLYVVGARPGVGKSAFLSQLAHDFAEEHGQAAIIMSYEMEQDELVHRELARRSGVQESLLTHPEYRVRRLYSGPLVAAATIVRALPVDYDFCPQTPIERLGRRILRNFRRLRRVMGRPNLQLGLVVVDYLQKILTEAEQEGTHHGNRTQSLETITGVLARLPSEFGCPIVLASQLNRESAKRPDARPVPTDLRGSGSIEQDAAGIIFLHQESGAEEIETIVAKQRHGRTGTAYLIFERELTAFRPSMRPAVDSAGQPLRPAAHPLFEDGGDLGLTDVSSALPVLPEVHSGGESQSRDELNWAREREPWEDW